MIDFRDRQRARTGYTLEDRRAGQTLHVWPDVELVVITDAQGQPLAAGQSAHTKVRASIETASTLLVAWRSIRAAWALRRIRDDGGRP
jgi:hypothetical protein